MKQNDKKKSPRKLQNKKSLENTNKIKVKNQDDQWIQEQLLKLNLDIQKENKNLEEKSQNFENNKKVLELQVAFQQIVQKLVENKDIQQENFYSFLQKELKEYSIKFKNFQNLNK